MKKFTTPNLRIESVERKEVKQEPPLLYDLITLQKEVNSKHGFSADKTLTIAQVLYEAKKSRTHEQVAVISPKMYWKKYRT